MGWWTVERLLAVLPEVDRWVIVRCAAGSYCLIRERVYQYGIHTFTLGLARGLSPEQAVALLNMLAADPVIPTPDPVYDEDVPR